MIECVHAYWLLLWLIGLFSRYSHRNCIINYPRRCHGRTMESPDEYLGRLNFPGACSVKGHHGALLRRRDGRSAALACALVCVHAHICTPANQFPPCSTHPRLSLSPPSALILFHYLFIVTLSVWCWQMGDQDVFVLWWTFLSGVPLLVMLLASALGITHKPGDVLNKRRKRSSCPEFARRCSKWHFRIDAK